MPHHPDEADLESLLDALGGAQIEFIVVGGVAAVLHGAPVTTLDVNIVHDTDEANVVKLTTERGPLDLLGSLHDGRTYADLLPHTVEVTDGSLRLRVLDLPTLIEIKSTTGRIRDQLVVPLLLALQREQDR